jgi:hypothetical protein
MTTQLTKTAKKYIDIIKSGKITESELVSLNSFYNKSQENKDVINAAMYEDADAKDELTLTDDQNKKGYDFLIGLRFTPTGKDRQNNPYGYREENILDNFSHFTFCGFYSEQVRYYIRMYN